jgi:hypothetical protein
MDGGTIVSVVGLFFPELLVTCNFGKIQCLGRRINESFVI